MMGVLKVRCPETNWREGLDRDRDRSRKLCGASRQAPRFQLPVMRARPRLVEVRHEVCRGTKSPPGFLKRAEYGAAISLRGQLLVFASFRLTMIGVTGRHG